MNANFDYFLDYYVRLCSYHEKIKFQLDFLTNEKFEREKITIREHLKTLIF
jgi:hypothetical protein